MRVKKFVPSDLTPHEILGYDPEGDLDYILNTYLPGLGSTATDLFVKLGLQWDAWAIASLYCLGYFKPELRKALRKKTKEVHSIDLDTLVLDYGVKK